MTIPEIISLPHRHQATSLPRTSQQARQTIENTQAKQLTAVTTTTVLKLHGPEKDLQNSRVCCSSIFSFWGNSKHFTNRIHIPGPLSVGHTNVAVWIWMEGRAAGVQHQTRLSTVCRMRSRGAWNPATSAKHGDNPLEHHSVGCKIYGHGHLALQLFWFYTLNILYASVHSHTSIVFYILLIHNASIVL